MVISRLMKTVLHISFQLPLEFPGCLDLYQGIVVSWMKLKIHSESYQILHINDITFYAVGTRMEIYVSVSLAYSQ